MENKPIYLKSKDFLTESSDLANLYKLSVVVEGHPLFEMYEENQNSHASSKVKVTILNSILTQRRRYLVLTRDRIITLLSEDFNWKEKSSLSTKLYPLILKELSLFLRKIKSGSGRSPAIYEVISADLLRLINLTRQEAMNQMDSTYAMVDKLNKS